jgi:hypothetical protein
MIILENGFGFAEDSEQNWNGRASRASDSFSPTKLEESESVEAIYC